MTAFKTTDGKIFVNEKEAKKHESLYDLKTHITSFVESYCWNSMLKSDIENVIFENYEELLVILKERRCIIMAIKAVKAYRTSDGLLFSDKAETHENINLVKDKIRIILDMKYDTNLREQIVDTIFFYREKLVEILKTKEGE